MTLSSWLIKPYIPVESISQPRLLSILEHAEKLRASSKTKSISSPKQVLLSLYQREQFIAVLQRLQDEPDLLKKTLRILSYSQPLENSLRLVKAEHRKLLNQKKKDMKLERKVKKSRGEGWN